MIRLNKVSHSFLKPNGQILPVLDEINLAIPQGSYYAIIGPQNAGKTTLARIMAGLLQPTTGQIIVLNRDLADWKNDLLRLTIGLVLSNPDDQIVFPKVEDDLAFGLENFNRQGEQIEAKVAKMLEFIDMSKYRHSFYHTLSGGQKQKLAIASMLMLGQQGLIFDEPTAYLDTFERNELLTLINKIHSERSLTIIYLAQYFEELIAAEKIIVLNNKRIQWEGSLEELITEQVKGNDWGIELPNLIQLSARLRSGGLPFPPSIHTVQEFLNLLKSLKRRARA